MKGSIKRQFYLLYCFPAIFYGILLQTKEFPFKGEGEVEREIEKEGEGGETLILLGILCLPVFYFVGWVFNHISGFRPFQNVFCLKQVFALPQKVNLIYIIVFNFYVS